MRWPFNCHVTALRLLSLLLSPLLPGPRAIPGVDPKSPTRLRRLDWNTGLCIRGSGRCPSLVTPTRRVQRWRGPGSVFKDLSMPLGSGFPLGLGGTRSRLGLVQGISGGFMEEVIVAPFPRGLRPPLRSSRWASVLVCVSLAWSRGH